MSHHYFPLPPHDLLAAEQDQWLVRVRQAEQVVGIVDGSVPAASEETLALFDRYVRGELTMEQVTALQQRRLGRRS